MARAGEVRVYFGGAEGLSEARSLRLSRGESRRWFGFSVSAVGDVNGDGLADLLVSDSGRFLAMAPSASRSWLYLGQRTTGPWAPVREWTDGQSDTSYGAGAGGGDLNGDGYSDVWIANMTLKGDEPGSSLVDVFMGGPSGPATAYTTRIRAASTELYEWGRNLAAAVDLDRDGYCDLVGGLLSRTDGSYSVRMFRGGGGGLETTSRVVATDLGSPYVSVAGSFVPIGDTNRDGIVDWVSLWRVSTPEAFRTVVLPGTAAGVASLPDWSSYSMAPFGFGSVLQAR